MASSTGTTTMSSGGSGSYPVESSGSEEDPQHLMDKKKKRMISNRESARRSRVRKQKHLDDLETQVSQLRKENSRMISSVNITTHHFMNVETENRILRAQVAELSHQLQSLNDIVAFTCPYVDTACGFAEEHYGGGGATEFVDEFMFDSLSYLYSNQPILASAGIFMY